MMKIRLVEFTDGVQVMEGFDALYGRPGPSLQKRMRQVTQDILRMNTWSDYLRMVDQPCSGYAEVYMTRRLRQAWMNSLQKRYHSKV